MKINFSCLLKEIVNGWWIVGQWLWREMVETLDVYKLRTTKWDGNFAVKTVTSIQRDGDKKVWYQ